MPPIATKIAAPQHLTLRAISDQRAPQQRNVRLFESARRRRPIFELPRRCSPGEGFAQRDVMEYRLRNARYSGLMLAARITLPHFSVSSAMNFPSSAGVIGIGTAPMSANCAA